MDERLPVLIYHIRDTAAEIAEFVRTARQEDLGTDVKLERAMIMSLLIVGELVSRIYDRYPQFVAGLSDVPWDQIRGLRNRIAHGYFELDLEIIWMAATTDVPHLAQRLEAALDESQSGS